MSNKRMTDFPFTILDVINALGLQVYESGNKNEIFIDCPECHYNPTNGHSGKGKCSVFIYEGIFCCNRCGRFGGGMLDLYCYYRNCDKSTANREMRRFMNSPVYLPRKKQVKLKIKAAESAVYDNSELAKREEIDKTYRQFLSLCTLAEEHKSDLLRRGLTEKNIAHFGFKSTPVTREEHNRIVNTLIKNGCVLEGVPGFFVNKAGRWDFCMWEYNRGYIVPMMNLQNQILGFQIRLDKPDEKTKSKYKWFSSKNKNKGVNRTSVPHITNTSHISKNVYITEGGLKADVAHVLSNRTFVSLAGVTQYKVIPLLLSQLKKNGVEMIIDAFDSDCKHNPSVEKARQKLKGFVLEAGLEYRRLDWDEKFKGIDDYIFANPKGTRKFIVYDK